MRRKIIIPRERRVNFYLRAIRFRVMAGIMLLASISVRGGPVFLEASAGDGLERPVEVFDGRSTEFVITLSSTATDTPLLSGDLVVVAGGLAVPLAKNLSFPLERVGEARAGVQRFKFSLEIPEAKRKQALVLKMKVRVAPLEEWLPLPAVTLSSVPATWKESLQRFARQVPCGRIAGSDRLQALFQKSEIEIIGLPEGEAPNDPSIRVWFAETSDTEFRVPSATRTVGVIFKKNVRGGLELWRPAPQSPPCVLVEADVLDRIDRDPAAQEIFERALSMARALIPVSSEPTPSS